MLLAYVASVRQPSADLSRLQRQFAAASFAGSKVDALQDALDKLSL